MMGYDNLMEHYKTNFALMHHHKYSLSEIENMIPWEKFIYIDLLKQHIREQNERMRDEMAAQKRR